MPPGIPGGAMCVQRFDDSLNSAIHTTYRISLRSSSMREPRRSEERRVGKECRSRWSAYHYKKKFIGVGIRLGDILHDLERMAGLPSCIIGFLAYLRSDLFIDSLHLGSVCRRCKRYLCADAMQ